MPDEISTSEIEYLLNPVIGTTTASTSIIDATSTEVIINTDAINKLGKNLPLGNQQLLMSEDSTTTATSTDYTGVSALLSVLLIIIVIFNYIRVYSKNPINR
jgi:hypothetical protein